MSKALPCARPHALPARKGVQASGDIGLWETGWPPLATYSTCKAQCEAISGAGRFVVTTALGQGIDAGTNAAGNRNAQEDLPSG
jgi:hypothetical protein